MNAKKLWSDLGNVPLVDEALAEKWNRFSKGTPVIDVWHWFEEKFQVSVAVDLMNMN